MSYTLTLMMSFHEGRPLASAAGLGALDLAAAFAFGAALALAATLVAAAFVFFTGLLVSMVSMAGVSTMVDMIGYEWSGRV